VATGAAGNLLVADSANSRIRVVAATSGTFYGPATSAELRDPPGVSVDGSGHLLIADDDNGRIRLVSG
jgi:hypothetical protein